MPTLSDILGVLQFVSYEALLLGLFLTALTLLITRDWRLLILSLLLQYILVGVILSRLVRPDIAVLKVMIGAFICPILFLSARQVSATSTPILSFAGRKRGWSPKLFGRQWPTVWLPDVTGGPSHRDKAAPTGSYFRLFVGLVLVLVTVTVSQSFPLPGLAPAVNTAVYWLVFVGLVILMLTEDPLKVGHGLFTLFSGFGMYYATIESSLLLTGLWGALNLVLALAIGYLTVVRGAGPEETSSW